MTSHFQKIITRIVGSWFYGYRIKTDYRPAWMLGLELDIYFPELQLAFEVQGEQHFQDTALTKEPWETQRGRDLQKIALCKKKEVSLITRASAVRKSEDKRRNGLSIIKKLSFTNHPRRCSPHSENSPPSNDIQRDKR